MSELLSQWISRSSAENNGDMRVFVRTQNEIYLGNPNERDDELINRLQIDKKTVLDVGTVSLAGKELLVSNPLAEGARLAYPSIGDVERANEASIQKIQEQVGKLVNVVRSGRRA